MLRSARWWLWLLCGIGVALVAFRTASLSGAFVWGDRENYTARPIGEIVVWWLGAWLLYAAALRFGSALPPRVPSLIALLLVALAARAAFFGTNPIQEDDAYRYLWDGHVALLGEDPYRWSPAEVAAANMTQEEREAVRNPTWKIDPDAPEVANPPAELKRVAATVRGFHPDRFTAAAPGTAIDDFRKVNHPTVPTVYPPLNMPVFALAQWLWPWKLDGLRAIFLALELATIAMLWFGLRAAGANPMWAAVYAWCPLTIKEMANSPHHDALVVCMLAAFLLAAIAEKPKLAAAALALATAAKLYPVALVPVLLVWAWRRDHRAAVASAAVFAGVLLACYAPFLHAHTFRGAGVFAGAWDSNAGAYSLIEKVCIRIFGDEPMISPIGGGQSTRAGLYARAVAAALVCGAIAAASFARVPRPAIAPVGRAWELPFRCYLALVAGFALAPAQHPWYFAGILPFVALFPYRSWVLLTGTLALYYLRFYFKYNPEEWDMLLYRFRFFFHYEAATWKEERDFGWIRAFEYVPFYLLLLAEGFRGYVKGEERRRAESAPAVTPAS